MIQLKAQGCQKSRKIRLCADAENPGSTVGILKLFEGFCEMKKPSLGSVRKHQHQICDSSTEHPEVRTPVRINSPGSAEL